MSASDFQAFKLDSPCHTLLFKLGLITTSFLSGLQTADLEMVLLP
jgi:hypothetical protein